MLNQSKQPIGGRIPPDVGVVATPNAILRHKGFSILENKFFGVRSGFVRNNNRLPDTIYIHIENQKF